MKNSNWRKRHILIGTNPNRFRRIYPKESRYSGADLREIRRLKGVGRPPCKTV